MNNEQPENLNAAEDAKRPSDATCYTDKQRLDYLDQLNKTLNSKGAKYGWKLDVNRNRVSLTDNNMPALSIREALDGAIRRAGIDPASV